MSHTVIDQHLPIRVIVAEDEEPLRTAISNLVAGEGGFELVGSAAATDGAIELARTLQPDVALLDMRISLTSFETDEGFTATAFIRDLTERRASDAMLRKNAKHFEALLESATDAVVVVDANGAESRLDRAAGVAS